MKCLCFKGPTGTIRNVECPVHSLNVETLARQLHDWYLEACEDPEAKYNAAAVVPYDDLPEGSKFLDRFIAGKISDNFISRAEVERVLGEMKRIDVYDGGEAEDKDGDYVRYDDVRRALQ